MLLIIQFVILQIIIFGVVIFVLKKILYSDTQGAIKRLEGVYQDLLKKQKDLTQKIEAAEKEYAEKKEEAIKVADKMKAEALEEIREKKDDILKQAKQQAEDMLGKAKASTEEHYRKIELEVERKNVDTAAELVNAALPQKMLKLIHSELLKEFMEKAKDFDLSGVGGHVEQLVVKTAFPLEKEFKDKLNQIVMTKLGRGLKLEEAEDKTAVAGIILQFGTLILDSSLPNYIREAAEKTKAEMEYKE